MFYKSWELKEIPKPISCHFLLLVLVLPIGIRENKMHPFFMTSLQMLDVSFCVLPLLIINAGVHPISSYLPSILYESALPRYSDSCWGYGNKEWALCLMEGLACGK